MTATPSLRDALADIAKWDEVNLTGEWPQGLLDIIKSITARARAALAAEDAAEGALTMRANDVRGMAEDIDKLTRVVRTAESALVSVMNDVAREKLAAAINALPARLRSKPLPPSPETPETKEQPT